MKYILSVLIIMTALSKGYSQKFSNPESLFDPSPYGFSHVASVPADRKFVFVAGQGGEEISVPRLALDSMLIEIDAIAE